MFVSSSSKVKTKSFFDSIIFLRFGETKVAKEEFYGAKKAIKIWDVDVDNAVICN